MSFSSLGVAGKNLTFLSKVLGTFALDGYLKLATPRLDIVSLYKVLENLKKQGEPLYFYKEPRFPKKVKIKNIKLETNYIKVSFDNILNVTDAEKLKTYDIYIESELYKEILVSIQSPYALINFKVFDEEIEFGEVVEITKNISQNLLSIKVLDGSEYLLPFVDEYILKIDYSLNFIVVKIPKTVI